MKKWEYIKDYNLDATELRAMGRAGWELAAAYVEGLGFGDGGGQLVFIFKRGLKKRNKSLAAAGRSRR